MVGLFLSVGLLVLFAGVQLGGQIIAQMSGMTLATVFSPGFSANVPLLSQFFYLCTLAFFLVFWWPSSRAGWVDANIRHRTARLV